jgi:hypothetical protein
MRGGRNYCAGFSPHNGLMLDARAEARAYNTMRPARKATGRNVQRCSVQGPSL